jgi:hypothetical protein
MSQACISASKMDYRHQRATLRKQKSTHVHMIPKSAQPKMETRKGQCKRRLAGTTSQLQVNGSAPSVAGGAPVHGARVKIGAGMRCAKVDATRT